MMTLTSTLLRAATAALLTLAVAAVPACGGCPWTHASAVTIEGAVTASGDDPAECLEVYVPDGDESSPGGCVNPALIGVNRCGERLLVEGARDGAWPETEVAPGEPFVVELDLGLAPVARYDDHYFFQVEGWLGEEPIELRFNTWYE